MHVNIFNLWHFHFSYFPMQKCCVCAMLLCCVRCSDDVKRAVTTMLVVCRFTLACVTVEGLWSVASIVDTFQISVGFMLAFLYRLQNNKKNVHIKCMNDIIHYFIQAHAYKITGNFIAWRRFKRVARSWQNPRSKLNDDWNCLTLRPFRTMDLFI